MDVHQELDALLANPECHAILINALGDYSDLLRRNESDSADEFELAHLGRSLGQVAALQDVFQRW